MALALLKRFIRKLERKKEITKRSSHLKYSGSRVIASIGFPIVVIPHKKYSLHITHVLRGLTLQFRLRGAEWIVLSASLVIAPKTRYTLSF
jgi:hypothetical protein